MNAYSRLGSATVTVVQGTGKPSWSVPPTASLPHRPGINLVRNAVGDLAGLRCKRCGHEQLVANMRLDLLVEAVMHYRSVHRCKVPFLSVVK